jgi:hypothetical protein
MTEDFLPNKVFYIMGDELDRPKGFKNKIIDLVARFKANKIRDRMIKERQASRIINMIDAQLSHSLEIFKMNALVNISHIVHQELK